MFVTGRYTTVNFGKRHLDVCLSFRYWKFSLLRSISGSWRCCKKEKKNRTIARILTTVRPSKEIVKENWYFQLWSTNELFLNQKAAKNFVTIMTKSRGTSNKFVNKDDTLANGLVLETCLDIKSSRGAFSEKHVGQMRCINNFLCISFVQNSVKYFRKLLNKRLERFWLDEFVKYTESAELYFALFQE